MIFMHTKVLEPLLNSLKVLRILASSGSYDGSYFSPVGGRTGELS